MSMLVNMIRVIAIMALSIFISYYVYNWHLAVWCGLTCIEMKWFAIGYITLYITKERHMVPVYMDWIQQLYFREIAMKRLKR